LLSEKSPGSHLVEVSVVEVYNNEVFDLLAKDNSGRMNGIKRDIMTNKEGKNDIPLLTNEQVWGFFVIIVLGMSGVTGSLLRETSFINRSLSALADVLGALSEQNSHIPYRNSKLTHLLQDAIGGDAKLLVILCVSPSQKYITESLQTLGFGSRARKVQRRHAKKRNELALNKSK
ncbi:kinesin-like protein KIF25, partial [Protobothrops mucrosquamatus]|uniref:kinesin-like protein KIF25 n=1 Tax=Protobothrops mucrosquamatus TaxID=103944 RepID=UPI000775D168